MNQIVSKISALRHSALIFCSALFLTACASNYIPETLNGLNSTDSQSLAGKWAFKIDPYNQGQDQKWWSTAVDTEHWDRIDVPGVWDIYDKYHDYTGTAWYRYEFSVDKYDKEKLVELVFDSVYHDSEVWLNDNY